MTEEENTYSILSQEISENTSHAINTANFVTAITGALIVAAFEFENPYIALMPLLPLYYGYKVLFNISQTITRTSAYIRIYCNQKYENRLYQLRKRVYEHEITLRRRLPHYSRWLSPHSVLWEEWMAPILQKMFIVIGFLCIFIFCAIYGFQIFNQGLTKAYFLVEVLFNITVLIAALFTWSIVAIRSRKTSLLHGGDRMMNQFEAAWLEVLSEEKASINRQEKE